MKYTTEQVHWDEVKTTDGRVRAWLKSNDGCILAQIEQWKTKPGWRVEIKIDGAWKNYKLVEMETWECQLFVNMNYF